jgi:2-isopropylmalate synthase
VYTAFSGSHQDAIKKGMHAWTRSGAPEWDVPYLPIDPKDIGRTYEAIIRVNSQSGKGGVAYLLLDRYGLDLPRGLQVEFAQQVQAITDLRGGELTAQELWDLFRERYLDVPATFELVSYTHAADETGDRLSARLVHGGEEVTFEGVGNGPIAALVHAFQGTGTAIEVLDYHEHALSTGEDATAAAYIEAEVDGEVVWGVAIHPSIATASLRAVVAAVNLAARVKHERDEAIAAFGD